MLTYKDIIISEYKATGQQMLSAVTCVQCTDHHGSVDLLTGQHTHKKRLYCFIAPDSGESINCGDASSRTLILIDAFKGDYYFMVDFLFCSGEFIAFYIIYYMLHMFSKTKMYVIRLLLFYTSS